MLSDTGSSALLLTALLVGITHTLMGPDHYLPFVALEKARGWTSAKTLAVTFLCGIGHVLGSVIIGVIGLAAGWSVGGLNFIESARGQIAAWLLTALGLIYLTWALKNHGRSQEHTHLHAHADGTVHSHQHSHHGGHAHPHPSRSKRSVTVWSLFVIFVFGPCEAFIPILLFPSIQQNWQLAVATTCIFAAATITTMLGMVYCLGKGFQLIPLQRFNSYGHVIAGCVLLLCSLVIHISDL